MVASQADSTNNPQDNPSIDEEIMRLFHAAPASAVLFLRTLLNDSDDAEEILQETSIVLWRKREQFVAGY